MIKLTIKGALTNPSEKLLIVFVGLGFSLYSTLKLHTIKH